MTARMMCCAPEGVFFYSVTVKLTLRAGRAVKKFLFQKFINGLQVIDPPVPPSPNLAKIAAEVDKT